jgi:ubiquinone biosynthesis protein
MLYFIVRLVANAIAVALTVYLTPGIDLRPEAAGAFDTVISAILLGLLFGLINAFVRPFALLLTGRLVIGTMGLFTLIINGLLFYLLAELLPEVLLINDPILLRSILAGALMALFVIILEALFGLDSPVIDGSGESKFYWRWLGKVPPDYRKRIVANLRLKQDYDTVRRFGIDILVDLTPLAGFRRFWQRLLYPHKQVAIEESAPETVRLMLQELGPTFVKLGQMAASRSEILPPEWQAELSRLHAQVDPFPYYEVQRIITQELGSLPEDLFTTFEPKPLAAASTAQIHRAILPGGEDVVVKVQRPDIDVTVRGDLQVAHDMVHTLEKRAKWARNLGLSGMLDEFSANVIEELDYRNEAYNARRLKQGMLRFEDVLIPTIYGDFSTSKVITMQYVSGVKMTQVEEIQAAGINRDELARRFIRAMNQQVLLNGFFHGDPHPGNVLVNLETSKIIFLDLGMMGQMAEEQRLALFDIIWSLKNGDAQGLTKILIRLSTAAYPVNEEALTRDIDRLLQRYVVYAEGTPSIAEVAPQAFNLLFRYGLSLDRSLAIALKGLMQAEELVRTLAPEISFLHTAVEEVQTVLLDQLDGELIYEKVKDTAIQTAKDALVRWPTWKRLLNQWAAQLESGKITIAVDTSEFNQQIESLDKRLGSSVQQLILGLLLVGMLLGSAIISTVPLDNVAIFEFLPQDLFIGIFIVVAGLSLIYVLRIIWNSWRTK